MVYHQQGARKALGKVVKDPLSWIEALALPSNLLEQ